VVPFALNVLGEKWSNGEVALMQVYAASKIAEQEITRLSEGLRNSAKIKHKVVIGSLDSHGLGKNIVARFLKANGVKVVDLGIEVTPEVFVETAIKEQVEAILISALMFNTSIKSKRVRELMDSADLRIPLMVGGAPYNFDAGLWRRMGADATSKNVLEAALELEEVLAKWNRMRE
jgi:trimethylamine corrinoid protein